MAISTAAKTLTRDKFFITAAVANTAYSVPVSMDPGLYTITCVSSTIANVTFYRNNTPIATVATSSGTVDYVLGQSATTILFYTNTGSNITINFERKFYSLPTGAVSGTLDTLTTSGTYTQTGRSVVVGLAGGQKGANGGLCGVVNACGGGSGGASGGRFGPTQVELTGNMSYTIGAGGTGASHALGGSTTFAGQTATSGGTGSSGVQGGGVGFNNPGSIGPFPPVIGTGTTGGGGKGGWFYETYYVNGSTGAGNGGIGKGGDGGNTVSSGTAPNGGVGTGYAAGGGGGGSVRASSGTPGTGGDGSQGVIYVLRF